MTRARTRPGTSRVGARAAGAERAQASSPPATPEETQGAEGGTRAMGTAKSKRELRPRSDQGRFRPRRREGKVGISAQQRPALGSKPTESTATAGEA